jgi:hypothetical protein
MRHDLLLSPGSDDRAADLRVKRLRGRRPDPGTRTEPQGLAGLLSAPRGRPTIITCANRFRGQCHPGRRDVLVRQPEPQRVSSKDDGD